MNSWRISNPAEDSKPQKLPKHLARQLDAIGATVAFFGNRFGPFHTEDVEFTWSLCFGCGQPFQYWGTVMLGGSSEVTQAEMPVFALGPCPRCGGMGKPLSVHRQVHEGKLLILSNANPAILEEDALAFIFSALLTGGKANQDAAIEELLEISALKRLGQWLNDNQGIVGAAGVAASVASIVMMLGSPEPDVVKFDPEQLEFIIDEVTSHFDTHGGSEVRPSGRGPRGGKSGNPSRR